MKQILAIYRAECFSPNSILKDRAIMDSVCRRLQAKGCRVICMKEDDFCGEEEADMVLTMGRKPSTTARLKNIEAKGVTVVNAPCGVEACARANIDRLMRLNNIPAAPLEGDCGYWIKRGDEAAQQKDDVVFATDETERERRVSEMKARGVCNIVETAHVRGDLVKFYGVADTGFFRTFYPGDDGISKFGDEQRNGRPHYYRYNERELHRHAERLSELAGVTVYGGDCIVRPDGTYAIIDFNDWPSFSRCREEAADAIFRAVWHGK